MEYRYLGKSGLKVSALSFGSWVTFHDQIGEDVAYKCMKEAYDAGVNFFDNAEVYANGQSEILMGKVLKKTGWKRSDLVLSTKIFWGGEGPNDKGLSRKHIIEGTDAALKRMQVDYVDLIFCHRPDIHTPIEETVRAMNHIINQGKAFYWGTSEWTAQQIMEAYGIARREHLIPPLMEQPEYNMFRREKIEKEYLPLYNEVGLGTTIWSPLASGLLTGKYVDGIPEGSRLNLKGYEWLRDWILNEDGKKRNAKVKDLIPIAKEIGVTMPELAIAWCLKNPNVSTVITGASNADQVKQNMKALRAVEKLTDEVMKKIDDVLDNKPQPDYDNRG
ncbi:MAG: aldo/keto reductase [Melioribacteraceae bacterium]|jgi:voltage-dependent potassium channel beta subunit|nr:MAG: voltage-dependent potassium channel subunit beta [Ignavibacteriales bacterium]WKZ68945.1 MAG: aldo/keto reductase [Melioribacteraceae bacterium]